MMLKNLILLIAIGCLCSCATSQGNFTFKPPGAPRELSDPKVQKELCRRIGCRMSESKAGRVACVCE